MSVVELKGLSRTEKSPGGRSPPGQKEETGESDWITRVSKTGEVLAFYALGSEVFKDYLFRNCYFERPATSRKHGNYGTVYEEDGGWFIRLNFQIRYRVG